ncbi:Translation initiation factor eIF-2B subunit beta [Rhizophlyctis rosea]|uniref:Translation initiation factor eIF2B subunit beta n=1 Tax=Rhizophlyctis rosea TaxID=64517 RepID=A0AAD5SIU2_9FUNG|nr:Translation initiation factor eIF-2B subunit beta [Rhizophlyctis rosea]
MSREINIQIDNLITKLHRRQVIGSFNVAIETARVLRNVVSASRWNTVRQLKETVEEVGVRLEAAQPIGKNRSPERDAWSGELAVGNMVKRVLHLIYEEYHALQAELREQNPDGDNDALTDAEQKDELKAAFKQGITEMIDELESSRTTIAATAHDHIHSKYVVLRNCEVNTTAAVLDMLMAAASMLIEVLHYVLSDSEIIMTVGRSRTVELFLKDAAKHRNFQVIVVETAPFYNGQEMAKALGSAGIDTTVISDSAVFAVMSRVNKVILGAHAVTANGGLVAVGGTYNVTAAAKYHATPVVVCSGLYKVCPSYPYDTDIYNLCISPDSVFEFEDDLLDKIDVVNPYFDFISPDKVSLFVTNVGSHPPSFIQRLIQETYITEDSQDIDSM